MIQKYLCTGLFLSILTSCSNIPQKHSLKEKLAAQWSNYTAARTLLLQRIDDPTIPLEKKPITRADWEKRIQLQGGYAILPADLAELKAEQEKRIDDSRQLALRDSVIQLDTIKRKHQIKKFCSALPKGGMLHVHPSGTLNAKSIHHLLQTQNPLIHPKDFLENMKVAKATLSPEEISWITSLSTEKRFTQLSLKDQKKFESFLLLPKGHQEFSRFNAVFHFIGLLTPELSIYTEAIEEFVKQARRERVLYVEFTGHVDAETLALVERIEKETHVYVRMNRSFNRAEPIEEIERKWQKTLALSPSPYLVGIDLLDNEDSNSALEKGQLLYGEALSAKLHRKTNLHRTMHAGELGDARNPRDAMILGAERLGHGVLLENDVVALEYASKIKMPIETNLSSNLRLTSVQKLSAHPYLKYLRLGLPVSLSTDDEGIFEVDINHECEIAIQDTDVTYSELKKMAMNSIETSFASAEDKSALLKTLSDSFAKFEPKWKN